MSDRAMADVARRLADALMTRAKTRHSDDEKLVLALQTELCAEFKSEREHGAVE